MVRRIKEHIGVILLILVIIITINTYIHHFDEKKVLTIEGISESQKNQIISVIAKGEEISQSVEFEIGSEYYNEIYNLMHRIKVTKHLDKTKNDVIFAVMNIYKIDVKFANGEVFSVSWDSDYDRLGIIKTDQTYIESDATDWVSEYYNFWENQRKVAEK